MDKIFFITMLYDFYGELLTDKQKSVVELYYLDDLSLNEIAQKHNITRQAVMDMLRRTEKVLINYENKLMLVDKYLKQKEKVKNIISIIDKIDSCDINRLTKIKKMLSEILD